MFRVIYISFIIFLFACSGSNKEDTSTPAKTVTKKKIKIEKTVPKDTLINNKNVVERLTAYGNKNQETIAEIYTSKGKIKIRLYKDTPLHRANFIMLAKKGYYDGCLFSRVVPNFMAQCGGSYDEVQQEIMKKIGYYSIPSEMKHSRFHKKGAIAAARSYIKNPDKRSEPDEFYFVEGTPFSEMMLDKYTADNNYNYTKTQRNYYLNNKGAAHLDGEHTVFGEIIRGFSVIPKLTDVETDSRDWPYSDLYVDSVIVIK
jgi:cyclophilin family peptidyl-prolyl cis-trans isomerase